MHEFSIASAILEQTGAVARNYGALTVSEVHVMIGAHRQVVPEMLRTAFDAAKIGTVAASATLVWSEVPLLVQCTECMAAFEPPDVFWTCPNCGGCRCQVLTGDELLLKSVVLEQDETDSDAPEDNSPAPAPD